MDDQRTNRASSGIRFRKLRIALSAGFGAACLLLILMWISSYWLVSVLNASLAERYVMAHCIDGQLNALTARNPAPARFTIHFAKRSESRLGPSIGKKTLGVFVETFPTGFNLSVAYWLPIAITGVLATVAATPWLPRRFGLRTFLIVITIAALAMGLLVWMRK